MPYIFPKYFPYAKATAGAASDGAASDAKWCFVTHRQWSMGDDDYTMGDDDYQEYYPYGKIVVMDVARHLCAIIWCVLGFAKADD